MPQFDMTGERFQVRMSRVLFTDYFFLEGVIFSGGIKGGMGVLAPRQKKKIAKISHFRQIFGFLPPQNRILPPRCPPQKKNSGAATDHLAIKN